MKKTILVIISMLLGVSAFAQQALFGGASTESPVINPDGTVTFRYQAPKAVKVTLSGDFLPVQTMEFDTKGKDEPHQLLFGTAMNNTVLHQLNPQCPQ